MRYSLLGYNLAGAIELKLDLADLTILRWFDDFRKTGKMSYKLHKGEKYYWIFYEKVIADIPILYIQKSAIYKRLRAMVDKQVLKKIIVKKCGVYTFYTPGENYKYLIDPNSGDNKPKAKKDNCIELVHEKDEDDTFSPCGEMLELEQYLSDPTSLEDLTYDDATTKYDDDSTSNTDEAPTHSNESTTKANEQATHSNEHTTEAYEFISNTDEDFIKAIDAITNPPKDITQVYEPTTHTYEHTTHINEATTPATEITTHTNEAATHTTESTTHSNEPSQRANDQIQNQNDQTLEQKINKLNSNTKIKSTRAKGLVTPIKLAALMYQKLIQINRHIKMPDIEKWSLVFEHLINNNGADPDELANLIRWIYQRDNFWCYKILTPYKLRDKYDQLCSDKLYDDRKREQYKKNMFRSIYGDVDLSRYELVE